MTVIRTGGYKNNAKILKKKTMLLKLHFIIIIQNITENNIKWDEI